MLRFTDDKFDKSEQPTIGVDFKVKHIEIDGQKIYLQIWVRFSQRNVQENNFVFTSGHCRPRKIQNIDSIILSRRNRGHSSL